MSRHRPDSGAQYELRAGDYVASIASVGASLRTLRHGGRDLVVPYAADEIRPAFRGCVLAPWPNRIARGRWSWRGEQLQLPITEPERGHALHGLVTWCDWHEEAVSDALVSFRTTVAPQPGYPFQLDLGVDWSLDAAGLECRLTVANTGHRDAPYGCGIHPYLVAPAGRLGDWILHIQAARQLLVDDSKVPTELVEVLAAHDFRSPRAIADAEIDHAFTAIAFEHGRSAVTLVDRNGVGARVVFGDSTPWVQVCTSDWPGERGNRAGVAVEPMTCPPNAFGRGDDIVILAPGAEHMTWWRLEAVTS